MAVSNNLSNAQILTTLSLTQDKAVKSNLGNGVLQGWLPETSAMGVIADYLSRITTSDVAQVGDLMFNGRTNAVLAKNPPSAT